MGPSFDFCASSARFLWRPHQAHPVPRPFASRFPQATARLVADRP